MTRHAKLSTRVTSYRTTAVDEKIHDSGKKSERKNPCQIIMIHGFNVPEEAARETYDGFLEVFRDANKTPDENRLGLFRAFHWPGDHPSRAASAAGYANRVGAANESGRLLAKYLGKLNRKQKVYIVAHSLGCRVALSALARIRHRGPNYSGATVVGVFLLAAAVPTEFCTNNAEPFGYQIATAGEYAYFSHHDQILRLWFPLGQRFYGEPRRAVGRHGEPTDRWTGGPSEKRLGHGEYWSDREIAKDIGRALGANPPRSIATNTRPAAELAGRRVLAGRSLNARQLGDPFRRGGRQP